MIWLVSAEDTRQDGLWSNTQHEIKKHKEGT